MFFVILAATVILGLYLAWTIGANDFANSMSDAVGSGAITIRRAIILGALCEFAGSSLVGTSVTDTVRKGIVDPSFFQGMPEQLALGMICALLAAALWLHGATWFGMPVSTTHSIVGAVAGFGVVASGWASVEWGKMGSIVSSWMISPVAGCLLAFLVFKFISKFILGSEQPMPAAVRLAPILVFIVMFVVSGSVLYKGLVHVFEKNQVKLSDAGAVGISALIGLVGAVLSRFAIARYFRGNEGKGLTEQLRMVEWTFVPLVTITSCSVAFAHGANDVANAIGPVAAVMDIVRSGTVKMSVVVPFWVLSLGGVGIVLGLATSGHKVMTTLGTKITQLTPSRGTAADLATVTTVLVCTRLKMPVSTTHTIVGAIIGVGFARGLSSVNRQVTRDIFGSWLITVPIAAVLTAVLFIIGRWLELDAMIASVLPR